MAVLTLGEWLVPGPAGARERVVGLLAPRAVKAGRALAPDRGRENRTGQGQG